MIAVILAGGKGTRMKPLTGSMPKHLLEIDGQTLIERLIEELLKLGIEEYIITVPSQKSPLTATVDRIAKDQCDITKIVSCSNKTADLIRCLRKVSKRQSNVCIMMGDLVFVDSNLEEFLEKDIPMGIDIVVGYTKRNEGTAGVRLVGEITSLTRDNTGDDRFSSGVYLVSPNACRVIMDVWDSREQMMHKLISKAIAQTNCTARILNGAYDLNTPRDYHHVICKLGLARDQ